MMNLQELNMADLVDLKTYIYKEIDKKEKRINYYAVKILIDLLYSHNNCPPILKKCKIPSIDTTFYYPQFEIDYLSYHITFNKNLLIYKHIFNGDYLKIDISLKKWENLYSSNNTFIKSQKLNSNFDLLAEHIGSEAYDIKNLIYYLDKTDVSSKFWEIRQSLENNYIIEPIEFLYKYRNVYPFSILNKNKDVFSMIVDKLLYF